MKKENIIASLGVLAVVIIWVFAFFATRVSAFNIVSSPTLRQSIASANLDVNSGVLPIIQVKSNFPS